jgi:hypothetical protein
LQWLQHVDLRFLSLKILFHSHCVNRSDLWRIPQVIEEHISHTQSDQLGHPLRQDLGVTYNGEMENDEKLEEFIQILGRIKDIVGEVAIADDQGINIVEAIDQLRISGNAEGADELAELAQRADELKNQQKVKK